jgi:hypothetical protein
VRVALVTASEAVASPAGELARRLRAPLAERCELTTFVGVAPDREAPEPDERDVLELDPRAHDRILYPVANDPAIAFVPRTIRAFGGAVLLCDWALPDLASAAFPALRAGGVRGLLTALREGGAGEAAAYRRGATLEGPGAELALNHSAVRHGDAFLVLAQDVKRRVVVERNAATPVAVLQEAGSGLGDDCDWDALAAECLDVLERMPAHRTARKASFLARVRQELELRRREGVRAH